MPNPDPNRKMEHAVADLSLYVYLYNASNSKLGACQKYGPFIFPSELTTYLPRLFEARDPQIGDLGIRMKMPCWTGQRNILIVDPESQKNGEINVFAIDNLPPGNNIISKSEIRVLLEKITGEDVLAGRTLYAASDEPLTEDPLDEKYLSGGILMISSAEPHVNLPNALLGEVSPIQEGPSVQPFYQLMEPKPFSDMPLNGDPPIDVEDLHFSDAVEETADEETRSDNSPTSSSSSIGSMDPLFSSSEDIFPKGQEENNPVHPQDPELPTVDDIIDSIFKDKDAMEKLEQAYSESFLFQERGGWVFANPDTPEKVFVNLAPTTASNPFFATDMENPSIDLNGISTNDVPPGCVLVANFHTHPLNFNEEPSTTDIENAYHRGIPGIVMSRRKIFGYGPKRRTNTDEPLKYAPRVVEGKTTRSTKLENNPFPVPYYSQMVPVMLSVERRLSDMMKK